MTTADLHKLFKVEYDKANVISSYPSFRPEEIDVWLNKGYLTVLSRKFAGNNVRQIPFEGDTSSVSDLQNLVTTANLTSFTDVDFVNNGVKFSIAELPFMYYVSARLNFNETSSLECAFTNHDICKKAMETNINKPWLPNPVCVMQDDTIVVYYDTIQNPKVNNRHSLMALSFTYCKQPEKIIYSSPNHELEVNDKVANEIISLAVYYALEDIESARVQTKAEDIKLIE